MSVQVEQYVAWKPETRTRGTFSIMVTCFTTLGFCVWSAIHLSIPRKRPTWYKHLLNKLIWVGIGLLLPELLILSALGQRMAAGAIKGKANKCFGFRNGKRWYYLSLKAQADTVTTKGSDLDGDGDSDEEESLNKEKETVKRHHPWTLVHGFYAKMGGFAFNYVDESGKPRRHVLSHANIDYVLENQPHLLPDLPQEDILDKSKADGLAKLLLFFQAGWFCVNCLSRLAQDLPLALMEVTTLAHALCSLSAYALWWDKPLNILSPTIISEPDEETRKKLGSGRAGDGVNIEVSHMSDDVGATTIFYVVGLSLIYGAPHLLAWNSVFPTHVEKLLWRTSALMVTCSGVAFIGIFGVVVIIESFTKIPGKIEDAVSVVACTVYGAASLYLVAESMRQLFHLPMKAFETPVWSNYFPHL